MASQEPRNVASTEQQAPNFASTEQQAPNVASTEQQAPNVVASTEQQAPNVASTEQQAPNVASTEQQDPNVVTSTEQQTPNVVASTEQQAPNVVASTEQQAPNVVTSIEQQAPNVASTKQQAPNVVASTEQQAPNVASTKQQAPNVVASTEQQAPNIASTKQQISKAVALRKFFARVHEKGESWDEYACALRALSEPCDFGDMKDALIRNRFVSGITDQSLRHLQYLKQAGYCTSQLEPNISQKTENLNDTGEQIKTQNKQQRFKKTSGAADGAGVEFEWQMLTLVYLRLLHSGSEFYIGSNMAAAGLFDDIVVKYRADSKQPWSTAMLQLKNKKNTAVGENALLALKNDFSLVKYCDSYCQMKSSQDGDLDFLGEFCNHQFIIFTNSSLKVKVNLVKEEIESPIFGTGGNANSFVQEPGFLEQLSDWMSFKLILCRLKEQIVDKNDADVRRKVIEVLSGLSQYKNKSVNSSIQHLSKNPTKQSLDEILKSLQPVQDKESYTEFLANLQLYTKQAEGVKLEKKIKQKITDTFNFTETFKTDILFNELNEKVKWWWKNESTFLTQDSRIWLDIIKMHVSKLSDSKRNELNKYNLHFLDASLNSVFNAIPFGCGGILNVIVDSRTTASSIKVMAALDRFGNEENILFVDVATLLHRKDEVIGLWSSRWCRILVVECDTELDQRVIGRLSCKIINVVEGKLENKLLVLIAREGNSLTETLDNLNSYKCHRDSCKWSDLTEVSRENLLGGEVELQGKRITLKTLLGENENIFSEKVNGDVISQLLNGETRCGKELDAAGDIFVPRRLRGSDGEVFSVNSASDLREKVVLVVAGPGMGKSTLITHLAHSVKTEDPTSWFVDIKLNDCTQHLATMDLENYTANAAKKMIEKIALNSPNSLDIALFRSLEENLIISIDGVDEVCPQYEKNVLIFLKHLKGLKIKQLWVSSRPIMQKKLESVTEVKAFGLKPFSLDDQFEFFGKAWKIKFPGTSDEKLKNFSHIMLAAMREKLNPIANPIWEVPLMASMVAEVFEENLRLFLLGNTHEIKIIIDTKYLYDIFMQKKCDLYSREKKKLAQETRILAAIIDDEELLIQFFHRNHRLAALRYLFGISEISAMQFHGKTEFETNLNMFLEDVRNGREKRGIIDNVTADDTPHFVHQTFAEYFVASWLSENFTNNKNFVEQILTRPEFTWIHDMFNQFLAKDQTIHTAVLNSDMEKVGSLLHEGSAASVTICNAVDRGGRTPLHLAVLLGGTKYNLDILQLLLLHKARVDVADNVLGWRPLQYADRVQAWTAAGMILAAGGNEDDMPTIMSIKQPAQQAFIEFIKQPLMAAPKLSLMLAAARNAGLPVVRYLVEERRGDVQCRGSRGETMLHMAAEGGDVELLEYLYTMEKSLHGKDSDHATPLHYAGRQGNTEAVRFLLERGLDLDAVDGHGETCLQIATRRGNYDVMALLIDKGAEYEVCPGIELTEEQREVSLLCAAYAGSLESVRILLEMGTPVSTQDSKGGMAIDIAWRQGHSSIVEFILSQISNGGDTKFHEEMEVNSKDVNDREGLGVTSVGAYIEASMVHCANRASMEMEWMDADLTLHQAAREGNVEAVLVLLQKDNQDINEVNSLDRTALAVASLNGHLDVVKMLLDNGASMVGDSVGDSPLHLASREGEVEVVAFLIKHVEDIDAVNDIGRTALALSSLNGHLDVTKLLVENGATMVRDKDDDSPLHVAAREGKVETASFLIKHTKDINTVNKDGRTALAVACRHGHLEVVKLLVKNDATMVGDRYGDSPLHLAAWQGKVKVVSFLLHHVKNINDVVNKNGRTALAVASLNGNLDVVKLLLQNGATIVGDSAGDSPLHLASLAGKVEVVSFLIQHVEDINAVNFIGRSSFALASYYGRLDVVKLFVENGASMVGDEDGDTPLHKAAMAGNVEVVSFLLPHAKNINVVNKNGRTALALASYYGRLDVVKFLDENGASMVGDKEGDTPLHKAAMAGNVEVVSFLLQHANNINVVNKNGRTALALASYGRLDVVKFLVENGASMIGDKDGDTPLHKAAMAGNVEVVSFLLQHAKNINVVNNNGRTALAFASVQGRIEVVKFLVGNGASMVVDNDGNSLLHLACKKDNFEVVRFLIQHTKDINAVNIWGQTPLALAIANRLSNIEKLLEMNGGRR